MSKLALFYEVPASHTIYEAAKDMVYEASVENEPVVSLFNGIKLTANPQSLALEIVNDYYAKMIERRRITRIGESRAEHQIHAICGILGLGDEV